MVNHPNRRRPLRVPDTVPPDRLARLLHRAERMAHHIEDGHLTDTERAILAGRPDLIESDGVRRRLTIAGKAFAREHDRRAESAPAIR